MAWTEARAFGSVTGTWGSGRDETSMPSQERVGLHEEDRPAGAADCASERGEGRTVAGFDAESWHLTVQDIAARAGRSRGDKARSGPRSDPRRARTAPLTPARNSVGLRWSTRLGEFSATTGREGHDDVHPLRVGRHANECRDWERADTCRDSRRPRHAETSLERRGHQSAARWVVLCKATQAAIWERWLSPWG